MCVVNALLFENQMRTPTVVWMAAFFFHLPKMLMCPSQVLAVFFTVEPVWSAWPAVLLRGLCVCFPIVYLHHLKWLVARVCVTLPPAWDHCRGPTTLNTLATFQTLWYDSLWRGVAAPPWWCVIFFFFFQPARWLIPRLICCRLPM